MKKYKTFGELLAFIRDNRKACVDEKVSFCLDRSDSYVYGSFEDAHTLLTRVYPIEVITSIVVGLKVITISDSSYLVIKLHVH